MSPPVRSAAQTEHEEAAIRTFVAPAKQERFLGFLTSPKRRKKLTRELAHFRWLDPRFVSPLTWKLDPKLNLAEGHAQGIENIVHLLRSKGARQTCWVISEDSEMDGKELRIEDALEHAIGNDMGTILSCLPGRLAVFVGEDEMLLLAK